VPCVDFPALIAIELDLINTYCPYESGHFNPTLRASDVGERWAKHHQAFSNEFASTFAERAT
jgi:hypothetical protein